MAIDADEREFDDSEFPEDAEAAPPAPRRRRRVPFWTPIALVSLLLIAWAAPAIVARTSLLHTVVNRAATGIDGEIAIGRAALGWTRPIVLTDVVLRDAEGNTVAQVDSVQGSQTLWSLLRDRTELGAWRIENPRLYVQANETGTNVQQTLGELLTRERPVTLTLPVVQLEIVNGQVEVEDLASGARWEVAQLNGQVRTARDWSEPLVAEISGAVRTSKGESPIAVSAEVNRVDDNERLTTRGQAVIKGESLPLDLAGALLRQRAPELTLAGEVSPTVTIAWEAAPEQPLAASARGELVGAGLYIEAPALRGDAVRLQRWKFPFRARLDGRQLQIESLALDCDVGKVSLSGPLTLATDHLAPTDLLNLVLQENYQTAGQLDLARLAVMLPHTLRVREGTEVTGGTVEFDMRHTAQENGSEWQGRLEMTGLTATNEGRPLRWKEPIVVTVKAQDGPNGPEISNLDCQASFLQARAAGALDALRVSAEFNLRELAQEAGQFIDLKELRLEGEGASNLVWKRDEQGSFELDGELRITDFALQQADQQAWTEPALTLRTTVRGLCEERAIDRIDSAVAELESGSDTAVAELTQPIEEPSRETAWPVRFTVQGQLGTWTPRLAPLAGSMKEIDLSGSTKATGTATVAQHILRLDDVAVIVQHFRYQANQLRIDEPKIEIKLAAQLDRQDRRCTVAMIDATSSAVALRARDIDCLLGDNGVEEVRGVLTFSTRLERLMRWFEEPQAKSPRQVAGAVEGRVDLTVKDGATTGKLSATVNNLGVADAEGWLWREPQIVLAALADYSPADDRVRLEKLAVQGEMLDLQAQGELSRLKTTRDLTLTGRTDCDMQKLLDLARPWVGEGVRLDATRQPRDFRVALSLSEPLKTLDAVGAIGWNGADLYGFPVGPAEIRAKVADGLCEIEPLDVAVSDGKLTTAPRIRLWPEPRLLEIEPGPLLTQVRITPEMCQRGLKFVLPVVADAAVAQGTFSIELQECHVPLGSLEKGEPGPKDADLEGLMTVHTVEVEAGPLVQELANVLDTLRNLAKGRPLTEALTTPPELPPVKLKKESVVSFRMVEGRVYHKDLALEFGDVTVKTYGSVGLDQSLAMMIEVPIPDRWLGDNVPGRALKGKTIRVPVSGSLKRPVLEKKAIGDLAKQFLRGGAEDLLREGLQKGLQKGLKDLFK